MKVECPRGKCRSLRKSRDWILRRVAVPPVFRALGDLLGHLRAVETCDDGQHHVDQKSSGLVEASVLRGSWLLNRHMQNFDLRYALGAVGSLLHGAVRAGMSSARYDHSASTLFPCRSRAFASAPAARRSLTLSIEAVAAWCNGVRPCASRAFGSAERSSSRRAIFGQEYIAAAASRVCPRALRASTSHPSVRNCSTARIAALDRLEDGNAFALLLAIIHIQEEHRQKIIE